MQNNNSSSTIFKPEFKAFFGYPMLKLTLGFAAIALFLGGIFVLAKVEGAGLVLPALVVFLYLPVAVVSGVVRYIQYGKEEYELTSDSIIARSGSVFSNNEVELNIKNITDVERIYPWMETMLFGTGYIKVESAGSATTEVLLQSVTNAQELTERVEMAMTDYGFDLSTDELIYQTKPSLIGVGIEIIGVITSLVFGSIGTGLYLLFSTEDQEFIAMVMDFVFGSGFGGILVLSFLILAVIAALRAADLRQRVYSVFSGVIRYEEGFLTKHYAVIPNQNLSDANVQQDILRRLFGIANVVLSTRGAQNQVKFANIPDAFEMEAAIDKVINVQSQRNQEVIVSKQDTKVSKLASTQAKRKVRDYSDFTGEFRRSLPYLLISPLLGVIMFPIIIFVLMTAAFLAGSTEILGIVPLILLPFVGFAAFGVFLAYVQNIISYYAVRYQVRENSIYESYSFLSRNTREFTLDKVTAIKFRRGLLQRLFGVCNISFYSIGSAQNIIMRDVPYSRELEASLLEKLGVKVGKADHDATYIPQFNVKDWFLQSIVPLALGGLTVLPAVFWGLSNTLAMALEIHWLGVFGPVMLVYLGIIAIGVAFHWWYQTTVRLDIYDEHLAFSGGIITLIDHYAALEYVKNTHSIKYPFTSTGTLKFDVAGAHYLQQDPATRAQQQRKQGQMGSTQQSLLSSLGNNNMITISYIPEVFHEHDQTDLYIAEEEGLVKSTSISDPQNKKLLEEVLFTTKASLWQAGGVATLVLVLTGFGVVLAPIVLPILLWYTNTKIYKLDGLRVSFLHGIFQKHKTTIINAQIDHIEKSENFSNKIFSTGNIQINTEGGQGVELNITDVENHQEFYSQIKQQYT